MNNNNNIGKIDVIKSRCNVLAKIINSIKEIYYSSDENQKAFIQTIIGAAIWYIPKPKNCWTGMISTELIKNFFSTDGKKIKISEEHVIPRKYAAKELLEEKQILTPEYVEEKYLTEYSKLHYITSDENKKVIKYQKTSEYNKNYLSEPYEKAEINLIEINTIILKEFKEGKIKNDDELSIRLKATTTAHNKR